MRKISRGEAGVTVEMLVVVLLLLLLHTVRLADRGRWLQKKKVHSEKSQRFSLLETYMPVVAWR